MSDIVELVRGLFTDPKQTMYRAREEEMRTATLALGAAGVAVQILLGLAFGVPFLAALVASISGFVVFFLPVWIGGLVTGGTGGAMAILQLCSLVYLPLGVLHVVFGFVHLGLIATVVGWIVMYFLMLVGHNFNGFNDVKFAYLASCVLSSVLGFAQAALVAEILVSRLR